MEILNDILRALGITIVHSLWQGAVVAFFIIPILAFTGRANAKYRYRILITGLFLLLSAFFVTFYIVFSSAGTAVYDGPIGFMPPMEPSVAFPLLSVSAIKGYVMSLPEAVWIYMATGWLAGFMIMTARTAGSAIVYQRKLRRSLEPASGDLQELFGKLVNQMGLSGIQLRIAYQDISPLVTGILHPLVVIPVAAISGLTTDQLKAIIMHELAHIKRYDHFMIILEALGRQVLFFNPVSWMLLREIEKERENSCDDVVVRANNNPINYIKALTMIQEMNIKNSAPSNALTGKSNQLLNRIKRIANSDSKQSVVFKLTAIVFLTAVLSVSAMALVIQEQRDVKVHADKQVISQPDSVKNNTKTKGHDPDKKKITVVIQDDSIKHMTVNGKPVKGKEMEAYADELKKMQEELQKSKMELDQVSRKLNEAQFELQFAQKDFHIDHFPPVPPVPGFNPEDINVEIMAEISKNHMSREELETILHDKAFTEEMKKAHEEAMKAHEEAWKEQMEYWRTHQDEIEKAKEEAAKAFEEFRKNYKHETEQEFWLHHGPDVPAPPMPGMMPEPEAPQAIPHMEMPEKPEKSETPAPSHQEEETVKHNSADKDAENDTELNSKLKELEE